MFLESESLKLIALNLEQFYIYLYKPGKLQQTLGLRNPQIGLDPWLKDVFSMDYENACSHGDNYLWYTQWQALLKNEEGLIGSLGFKGPPDQQGVVEIGYGLEKEYRSQGWMTQLLSMIIPWALNQPSVTEVIAKTDMDNLASQRVLYKSGFNVLKG